MDLGWEESADAWIRSMGDDGDWSRKHVMDRVMLGRVDRRAFETALDVGCGEGRFCRMLKERGIRAVGIDATAKLVEEARRRDPKGDYRLARAENLPFDDASFDLVVCYLALIDIEDFRDAIAEMARVARPGGIVLVANLSSFSTGGMNQRWIRNEVGEALHWPVDRYLYEFGEWVEWVHIRVHNFHRPLSAYMSTFLEQGLRLTFFDEPEPDDAEPERSERYRRCPWLVAMEWEKPV
ncbi:MAG: class I SAM-dependent methyltransferase [Pseudomonadota bacterium]